MNNKFTLSRVTASAPYYACPSVTIVFCRFCRTIPLYRSTSRWCVRFREPMARSWNGFIREPRAGDRVTMSIVMWKLLRLMPKPMILVLLFLLMVAVARA